MRMICAKKEIVNADWQLVDPPQWMNVQITMRSLAGFPGYDFEFVVPKDDPRAAVEVGEIREVEVDFVALRADARRG